MSMPLVLGFVFDDENEAEMSAHGVTPTQALQVLANGGRIGRNRKQRRATHMIVGRDDGGACIALPIEPTHEDAMWRPVTAWYCKPHEWGLIS